MTPLRKLGITISACVMAVIFLLYGYLVGAYECPQPVFLNDMGVLFTVGFVSAILSGITMLISIYIEEIF